MIFRSDIWWVDGRCSTSPPPLSPSVEMKLHRRRAERDAGNDEFTREICKSNRTGLAWSFIPASRKAVYRNEYFSISRRRLDSRTRDPFRMRFPRSDDPIAIINELITRARRTNLNVCVSLFTWYLVKLQTEPSTLEIQW